MNDLSREPYYFAAKAPKRFPESKAETQVRRFLTDDNRKAVSDAVEGWNTTLRDAVRSITALHRLSGNVPVDVTDGMPGPLASAVGDFEPLDWWLVLHRPSLEQADHGLRLIIDHRDMLANYLADIEKRSEAIGIGCALIAEILSRSREKDFLDRFRKIEEDILGAYWIHASRIQIYWMPLAIFASVLQVSLMTLTVAVLCHEFVHAYTHRGVDLNGHSWQTAHFIATDIYVKEGLAQYYTEQIMSGGLGARLPNGIDVFREKTSRQAPPYTTYQNWLGNQKQPSPEATRTAMLEFRNVDPPTHESFVTLLKAAEQRISA